MGKTNNKNITRIIIILAAVFILVGAASIAVVATMNSRPFQEEPIYSSSQQTGQNSGSSSSSFASVESTAPEFQEKQ